MPVFRRGKKKSKETHQIRSPISDSGSFCTASTKSSSQSFGSPRPSVECFNRSLTGVDLHIPSENVRDLLVERLHESSQDILLEEHDDGSNEESSSENDEETSSDDTEDDSDENDSDNDPAEILQDLQQTIESLMDRVTSQIGVSRQMARKALEKHGARQSSGGGGGCASSTYSFRKYSCQRMRLQHCQSMRDELSVLYESLEREFRRLRESTQEEEEEEEEEGNDDQRQFQMDIFQVYNKVEELKAQIEDTAPSAVHSHGNMVEQLGQLMLQNDPDF